MSPRYPLERKTSDGTSLRRTEVAIGDQSPYRSRDLALGTDLDANHGREWVVRLGYPRSIYSEERDDQEVSSQLPQALVWRPGVIHSNQRILS